MSKRANALAERIEQGAEALATFAESLTDAEWQKIIPNEQRPISVLVHHVAVSYPVEIDLALVIASGKPITGVTTEIVDESNAQHAQDNPSNDKKATIQLLRENSKVAADRVREFTNEELDSASTVSLNAEAPLTSQFFIEDHALRHSFHHLANIRAALDR